MRDAAHAGEKTSMCCRRVDTVGCLKNMIRLFDKHDLLQPFVFSHIARAQWIRFV